MTAFVVDFQGFKNNLNKFIVKEFAITSIGGNFKNHCFIKSPYSFNSLLPFYQRQVTFNRKFYHGIPWSIGDIYFHEFHKQLLELFGHNGIVYVKGTEKAIYLKEQFPNVNIINLEESNPSLPALKNITTKNDFCVFHKNSGYICAQENVTKMLSYLKK